MKLSEAIRLGAMIRPQGFHSMFQRGRDGRLLSCALGAAWEASGSGCVPEFGISGVVKDLTLRFPILKMTVLVPKELNFGTFPCSIQEIIFALNDNLRWTREQIADYVAEVEAMSETKKEELACVS